MRIVSHRIAIALIFNSSVRPLGDASNNLDGSMGSGVLGVCRAGPTAEAFATRFTGVAGSGGALRGLPEPLPKCDAVAVGVANLCP
jgi:hypothetical protein